MTERIAVDEARRESLGIEQFDDVERDVLFAIAGVGDRGDPRHGAHFDELAEAMQRWYDDNRITPESVEDVCLRLADTDYVECVGTGAFRATTDGLELAEAYLMRLGSLWGDVKPWSSGDKVVVERRQVAEDYSEHIPEGSP